MINKLLKWLESKGRMLVINRNDDEIYLVRYIILRTKWLSIYFHRFMASDSDIPHDHPWVSFSLMIQGIMKETILNVERNTITTKYVRAGDMNIRQAAHTHKLEVSKPRTFEEREQAPLTLFIAGPRVKSWGFVKDGVWTLWTKHLGLTIEDVYEKYGTTPENV